MAKWRPIPGFEETYVVSDQGQVVRTSTHGVAPKPIWRPLATDTKPNGYVYVDLMKDNRRHRRYVHQLVWEAFKGPIPSGLEPNHKRGIRSDNRLSQLELVNRSGNMLHSFKSLNPSRNRTKGSAHHKSKLTEDDVKTILALLAQGMTQKAAGARFGISQAAVHWIVKGKNWKHLTGRKD